MSETKKKVLQKKLARPVYAALKNVVGEQWIYEQRSVVETYSKMSIEGASFLKKHEKDPHVLPACAVLPGSIDEVQAIVKICNRYACPFYSLHQWPGLLQPHQPGADPHHPPVAHEPGRGHRHAEHERHA